MNFTLLFEPPNLFGLVNLRLLLGTVYGCASVCYFQRSIVKEFPFLPSRNPFNPFLLVCFRVEPFEVPSNK